MKIFKQTAAKHGQVITTKKWYVSMSVGKKRVRLPLFESEKNSLAFVDNIETMISQHKSGVSYDPQIQLWLSQIAPAFLDKFAALGYIDQ